MSNVADKIDINAHMVGWLGALTSFYVKDLKALPEDKLTATFGGCSKSPLDITGQVIGLFEFATLALQGKTSTGGEDADVSSYDTMDKLVAAMQTASGNLAAAIQNASDEIWTQEVMPPWQMKDTVFGIVNTAINHVWYHDGQINTYQCLLGDDKVHWMD